MAEYRDSIIEIDLFFTLTNEGVLELDRAVFKISLEVIKREPHIW